MTSKSSEMVQFSCKCGSKQFTLVRRMHTKVDFSREGAIEGHPFISDVGGKFDFFICDGCNSIVNHMRGLEMLKEVL